MKWLKMLGRSVIFSLLTAVLFLLSCQSRIIYYPRPYDAVQVDDMTHRGGRKLEFTTSQGKQTAFYLPPLQGDAKAPRFLWFIYGGNGSLALDYADEPHLWDKSLGYVFVDYPSYGLCQGKPTPGHIEENAVGAARMMCTELGWTEEELANRSGVFGHSIGCAAALIMADKMHQKRAVLCAPFTTLTDMGRIVLGWPLCHLNMHRFNNLARLDSLSKRGGAEVRVFHGTLDEVIPVTMARTIAQKYPGMVKLTEMPESHHNDVVVDARTPIGRAIRELSTPD